MGGGKVGNRMEIEDVKKNKEVQELGKFSVEEYNVKIQKEKGKEMIVKFLEVVEGQMQVVAGYKYYLKFVYVLNVVAEIILEQSIQSLDIKFHYLREKEKLIEGMTHKIDFLHTVLANMKMRTLRAKRRAAFTRCKFLKFIKDISGQHLLRYVGVLEPHLPSKDSVSYVSQVLHQLSKTLISSKIVIMRHPHCILHQVNCGPTHNHAPVKGGLERNSVQMKNVLLSDMSISSSKTVSGITDTFAKGKELISSFYKRWTLSKTTNGYGLYGHNSNQFPSTTTEVHKRILNDAIDDRVVNRAIAMVTAATMVMRQKESRMSDTRFMDNGK
ncbi:hypothetical protein IFM89_023686 [Coptis chinensis]|uniref:Cystatin domain-containing protein n=1 Tax=Coptis chinensis TaxID=261450 RepID=A0A835GZH5_9MAGN|nr:hypothetical protein IFM89_023686 [Coptis chinensis]